MVKSEALNFEKLQDEVLDMIGEHKKKRRFLNRVLTNAVRFDILKKFKHNKTNKKEITMNEKPKTNKVKKPLTIQVWTTLLPWAIIVATVVAGLGIWGGISYEKHRAAEIQSAVQLSKTSQQ